MTDDRSHRLSRGPDLPMRFLLTDSSWYEDYWLSEPRPASIIVRSRSTMLAWLAFACDRAASILRAALAVVFGPASLRPSTGRRRGVMRGVPLLCTAFILESANHADAQCAARDVLQRQLMLATAPVIRTPHNLVTSASDVAVWKTIEIGTFSDSLALLDAMRAMGCSIGDAAAAALAQPSMAISSTKSAVELVTLSAAELGFRGETASLRQIYSSAQRLGFKLASAEIAPQLRLQYLDQPIGEFLTIGMAPIHTSTGEAVILTVANGGAGLILIGQDGRADVEIPLTSRFVFVRSKNTTPEKAIQKIW